MSLGSLRLRLLLGAAGFVVAALIVAAVGLTFLFERHVGRWINGELAAHVDQLIAGIDETATGELVVARLPGDPRFQRPLSGLYWEVNVEPEGPLLRSRSLWDYEIPLPAETHVDDALHTYTVPGPDGKPLHLVQRRIALPARLGAKTAGVAVAIDRAALDAAVRSFASALIPLLLVLGVLITAAAWAQVSIGLRPLAAMRRKLAEIASGQSPRLGGGFPDEVLPLAHEIDSLLEARERQVEKARTRAADLAHGLKTPLQLLSDDAQRLKAQGETDLADDIEHIANAMRQHVERELARARTGATGGAGAANIEAVAQRVVRVIERTPDGQRLAWQVDVPGGLLARIDPEDLTEALGNLVENASRHARSSVVIRGRPHDGAVVVSVIDDGAGIPPARAQEALRRGGRLDTSGSAGLGLAIVGDIAEAWGATLSIESPEHGCHVSLRIPAARLPAKGQS
ncbi:MAG: HAMP domain-containing sensor histidine kinase [Hyphomicrobium sp.]|jgi:signal transduction histidine kinase